VRKDIAVRDQAEPIGIEQFLQTVANEAKSRVNKTSL
jgi:hypothetical protein